MLITLARKPLTGSVVQNCVQHGCGALNVDASRIGGGRWPANVLLTLEATGQLDEQSGVLHARGNRNVSTGGGGGGVVKYDGAKIQTNHHTRAELHLSGGASRFFKKLEVGC